MRSMRPIVTSSLIAAALAAVGASIVLSSSRMEPETAGQAPREAEGIPHGASVRLDGVPASIGTRDLARVIDDLLSSAKDADRARAELEERLHLGILQREPTSLRVLHALESDTRLAAPMFRNVAAVKDFLLRLVDASEAFTVEYQGYAAVALSRSPKDPHRVLVSILGKWLGGKTVEFRQNLAAATTPQQVAALLERLLVEDRQAAYAALRSTIPLWIERRSITSLFPAVLGAMTTNPDDASNLAVAAAEIAGELQLARETGTAEGVTLLGSAGMQWMISSPIDLRALWVQALTTLPLLESRPGSAMFVAMNLGAAGDRDRLALGRLSDLYTATRSQDVMRTALVNLGNVGTLADLEGIARLSVDRVPTSRDELLHTLSFFSAVHNVLARHPEDEERAGELFVQGLQALGAGVDPDVGLDALLRFLLERPVTGTEEALRQLSKHPQVRVAAVARRALERADAAR